MKNRILIITSFLLMGFIFQSCSNKENASPFDNANGKKGGIYYDTFWAVEGEYDQKDTAKLRKLNTYSDFFRCKQCHGWDLEGDKASYINRGPNKTRPSVSSTGLASLVASKTPEQLFISIKSGGDRRPFSFDLATYHATTNKTVGDKMPNYGELLTDAQIWDIVKFMKTEAVDVKELYDYTTTGIYPTGRITYSNFGKGGDMAKGKSLFVSKGCSTSNCHGANGTALLVDNATYTIGGFFRAKPHEAHHKIKFGQLGSTMKAVDVTLQDLKDIYKATTDTIAFPLKK